MRIKSIRLLLIFCLLHTFSFSQNIDLRLLKSINQNESTGADKTFKFITNTATPFGLAAPVSMISIGLIRDDRVLRNNGYATAASAILSVALTTSLKYTFDRSRPFVKYPEIHGKVDAHDPSFPSGHTTIAFATATSLSLSFPKVYVIVPAYLWAAVVSYSRMYLGVHFPSDILGGIVIGVGTAFLCYQAQEWF